MAGSVNAQSHHAASFPTNHAGEVSQCVPLLHQVGPHTAPARPGGQHLEFAGVLPLHVPPASLHEPMNLEQAQGATRCQVHPGPKIPAPPRLGSPKDPWYHPDTLSFWLELVWRMQMRDQIRHGPLGSCYLRGRVVAIAVN
jgi:hypothetical protein